ncbi:hypothetical protein TNCV_3803541 [Trichonephila clavipes]|nr:hypothetical protein TNCV_3803541 [Trichonephila clavipes]
MCEEEIEQRFCSLTALPHFPTIDSMMLSWPQSPSANGSDRHCRVISWGLSAAERHIKPVEAQNPLVGMVWKLKEGASFGIVLIT